MDSKIIKQQKKKRIFLHTAGVVPSKRLVHVHLECFYPKYPLQPPGQEPCRCKCAQDQQERVHHWQRLNSKWVKFPFKMLNQGTLLICGPLCCFGVLRWSARWQWRTNKLRKWNVWLFMSMFSLRRINGEVIFFISCLVMLSICIIFPWQIQSLHVWDGNDMDHLMNVSPIMSKNIIYDAQ